MIRICNRYNCGYQIFSKDNDELYCDVCYEIVRIINNKIVDPMQKDKERNMIQHFRKCECGSEWLHDHTSSCPAKTY